MIKDIEKEFSYRMIKQMYHIYGIADVDDEIIIEVLNKNTIRNKCKRVISDSQIEEIMNLLHDDYKYLSADITIYNTRIRALLDMFNDPFYFSNYNGVLSGKVVGTQNGETVNIYNFSIKYSKGYKDFGKLHIVYTLFHELRHVYQMKYKKNIYYADVENYIPSGEGYRVQAIEKDADSFAQRMMNKNMKKINEILGVKFEWFCCFGTYWKIEGGKMQAWKSRF